MSVAKADSGRLAERLDHIANISDTEWSSEGVTRLAYTPTERSAHESFRRWMTELGLKTWSDSFGNSYAEYSGTESRPAIGTGSHLDSVPGGGRFDGIVGVVAAAEVAELLVHDRVATRHPVRFVAFAAEEGARFGQGLIGSRGAAGRWTVESLAAAIDAGGVGLLDAMRSVGLSKASPESARWDPEDWRAFLELHVEQGDVLIRSGVDIGIVHTVSGSTRLGLTVTGRSTHSGGTPMTGRRDALCAAAEIVLFAEKWARDATVGDLRCTVGRLEVSPGSLTTIPGEVSLWIDVRGTDLGAQRSTIDGILAECGRLERSRDVVIDHRRLGEVAPTRLPEWPRRLAGQACEERGNSFMEMPSGASHDSQVITGVVPASIIFVHSEGGLSHVPDELTEVDDVALGADVLLDTILRVDRDDRD